MKTVKVKEDFDFKTLAVLGYIDFPLDGGYVSADGATIVSETRRPYERQVMQYCPGAEDKHEANVDRLRHIGAIEESL